MVAKSRSKKSPARKPIRGRIVSLVPPAIGEYWKGQGGIYAGVMRGAAKSQDHHLILHPDFCKKAHFGAYGIAIKGASDEFDGRKNTSALRKVSGIELRLAEIAALKLDGHQDFFIQARFQSALLYANLRDKFDLSDWYWTSTVSAQCSDCGAWGQYFHYGLQFTLNKAHEYYVRPVRSIPIR